MKIESLKVGATIPTQSYGNIQPEIILADVPLNEGTEYAMNFIKEMYARYSEKGSLIEKEVILARAKIKSFNEDVEIDYEPIYHTYSHGNNTLVSATEYIKKFFKEFDAETISSVLESKWKVPAQTIKELWNSNGELTSDFGNVVHKALEYYQKYKEVGSVISSQQGEDKNYALPKHPILREIILGLEEKTKDDNGSVVVEVLVSDIKNGICGRIDNLLIINEEKKICRVRDYKVNINSEDIDKNHKVLKPFDNLPSNKLSKYQLQLSVYANMLQKSGWTVEGLDVYVYEDEWKHYVLDVLDVVGVN